MRKALVVACIAAAAHASVLDGLETNRGAPSTGATGGHGPATAGKPAGDGSSKFTSKIAAGLHKLEQKLAPTPTPAPGIFERIAHAFARHERESPPSLWDRIFGPAEPVPQPSGLSAMASHLGDLLSGRSVPEDTTHTHGHLGHPHAKVHAQTHGQGHGAGLHVSVPTFGVPTLWSNAMATLRTAWLVATFFIRLGWSIFSGMVSRGWAVSAWVLDVLLALVVWDAFRSTVWGPTAGKSLLARLSRIVTRSLAIVWGHGQDAASEALRAPGSTQGGTRGVIMRWGRLGLVLFVAAPVLVTAILFVMLPAALFALAIKNAVPAAVAMAVFGESSHTALLRQHGASRDGHLAICDCISVALQAHSVQLASMPVPLMTTIALGFPAPAAFVHALTVPPFSYLVNSSFVEFLIVCWRIMASVIFIMRAQRAAIAVKEHGAELKAYAKGTAPVSAGAGAGGAGMDVGIAGGQQAAAAAGGVGQPYVSSAPLEGLVDRNILLGDAMAARVEGAVDAAATRLLGRGKSNAAYSGQPQQPQQAGGIQPGIQPEDDIASGGAVGTQPSQPSQPGQSAGLPRVGDKGRAGFGRSGARAASPIYEEDEAEGQLLEDDEGVQVRTRQGQARRRYPSRQQQA